MKVDTIYDKGVGIVNEDNYVISDNLFGVFDGATSFDKYVDANGKTGGYIASVILKKVFEQNNGSLNELAIKANMEIKNEMFLREIDMNKKINLWSSSAAVVRINKDNFDWLQIGDSLILVVFKDETYKLLTKYHNHDKETLMMWKELADKKTENIRKILNDQLIKVRHSMNIFYGVFNGENSMKNFLNQGNFSLKNVKHIILFTDGIILPKENPEEKEDFDMFVKLYLNGGLNKVKNYVRKLENKDVKCWKYPRFKKHDDIAAIALSF